MILPTILSSIHTRLGAVLPSASRDRIKARLVGTIMEQPLEQLRTAWGLQRLFAHPELHAIYTEDLVIGRVLRKILRPDSCCVDVGCHIGMSLSKFRKLASTGRHLAVEPIPYKAASLRSRFPEVEVVEVALAADSGETTFFINTALSGFSGLRQHGDEGQHEALTVRKARLDEIVGDRRVDFLKIDVEGGELGVLQGATVCIERCRPTILFECTRSGLSAYGLTAEEIFDWLSARGYGVWLPSGLLADAPALDRERFAAAQVYPFEAFNFFARPLEETSAAPARLE